MFRYHFSSAEIGFVDKYLFKYIAEHMKAPSRSEIKKQICPIMHDKRLIDRQAGEGGIFSHLKRTITTHFKIGVVVAAIEAAGFDAV